MTTRTPILDAHIHLWNHRTTPRKPTPLVKLLGWNTALLHGAAKLVFPRDQFAFYGRPDYVLAEYLGPDYADDARAREVTGFVHVQAGWEGKGRMGSVGETVWLESLGLPRLRGIVGHADLAEGARVGEVLDAHLDASERFRGIRDILSWHPAKGVHDFRDTGETTRDATWRAGYEELAKRGLSFDMWGYHHQLGDFADLASDYPEVPVVLCHSGTPVGYAGPFCGAGVSSADRDAIAGQWREGMQRVAEQPHVYVKLSGLMMPCVGWNRHTGHEASATQIVDELGPMLEFVIEVFGIERCMYASNFPIDKVSHSWIAYVEALEAVLDGRSEDDRRAVFHDNAARFYRVDAQQGRER